MSVLYIDDDFIFKRENRPEKTHKNNFLISTSTFLSSFFFLIFVLVLLSGFEPELMVPKGRPKNVASSTFHIIFYHKIPYPKTLNSFIYRHFNHFILSNNIIQYKRDKIQHKTPHLQKFCIFLAKICSSY